MVLTTLSYLDCPIRFVQFPAVNGAPTKQDPKAFLVVDDDVLDSFGFRKPFRKLIKGIVALAMTDPVDQEEDTAVFLHKEIQILGEEKDIIPMGILSYLAEYRAPGDTSLKAFTDYCFTQAWDLLNGSCLCRSFVELDSKGDLPRPKLERTAASDGVETLEDAIQRIEEMALDKAALVKSIEDAYQALATLHRSLKATKAARKAVTTRRRNRKLLLGQKKGKKSLEAA
jgi:hypothetical protein